MARRLIMGAMADGNFGLRCSHSGFDANANPPNPNQLAFDSNWASTFPVHWSGVINYVAPGATYNLSYPGGDLGFEPFSAFVISTGNGIWVPAMTQQSYQISGGVAQPTYLSINTFSSYLEAINNTSSNYLVAGAVFRVRAF